MQTTAGESVEPAAEWPPALEQVFAEPWRIRPAFQPIVDLRDGRVWGFQVLARFISVQRATPPEWLEAAERLGLRDALEARLVTAGVNAVRELPGNARLLLPVSAGALLAPEVQHALRQPVKVAQHLVLDLTGGEHADVERIALAAENVRRRGVSIALLAGSSPGGLDALPRLAPDVLKLGRDYVAGVEDDAARRAVIEGLAQLVTALGGRLLAVGIESREQLDTLVAAGISLGQGYGLGRPVPSMIAPVSRAGAPLRAA